MLHRRQRPTAKTANRINCCRSSSTRLAPKHRSRRLSPKIRWLSGRINSAARQAVHPVPVRSSIRTSSMFVRTFRNRAAISRHSIQNVLIVANTVRSARITVKCHPCDDPEPQRWRWRARSTFRMERCWAIAVEPESATNSECRTLTLHSGRRRIIVARAHRWQQSRPIICDCPMWRPIGRRFPRNVCRRWTWARGCRIYRTIPFQSNNHQPLPFRQTWKATNTWTHRASKATYSLFDAFATMQSRSRAIWCSRHYPSWHCSSYRRWWSMNSVPKLINLIRAAVPSRLRRRSTTLTLTLQLELWYTRRFRRLCSYCLLHSASTTHHTNGYGSQCSVYSAPSNYLRLLCSPRNCFANNGTRNPARCRHHHRLRRAFQWIWRPKLNQPQHQLPHPRPRHR